MADTNDTMSIYDSMGVETSNTTSSLVSLDLEGTRSSSEIQPSTDAMRKTQDTAIAGAAAGVRQARTADEEQARKVHDATIRATNTQLAVAKYNNSQKAKYDQEVTKTLDAAPSGVEMTTELLARYNKLNSASQALEQNIEDRANWNPFVSVPASLSAQSRQEAVQLQQTLLQNSMATRQELTSIRADQVDIAQTRSDIMTQERVKLEGANLDAKGVMTIAASGKQVTKEVFANAQTNYNMTDKEMDRLTARVNQDISTRNLSLAEVQVSIQAETMKIQSDRIKQDAIDRKNDEKYWEDATAYIKELHPNADIPARLSAEWIDKSGSIPLRAAYMSFRDRGYTNGNGFDFENVERRIISGANDLTESERIQYNLAKGYVAKAQQNELALARERHANEELPKGTVRQPFDEAAVLKNSMYSKSNPMFNRNVNALVQNQIRKAEVSDATEAVTSGAVNMPSMKTMAERNHLDLSQTNPELAKFVTDGTIDLDLSSGTPSAQINAALDNAVQLIASNPNSSVKPNDLAKLISSYAKKTLSQNNASTKTLSYDTLTFPDINSGQVERGAFGSTNVKIPLDITNNNQLLAVIEARFKAMKIQKAKAQEISNQGRPTSTPNLMSSNNGAYTFGQ